MGFCDCPRPCSTSRDNVAVHLKHPLGHLIAFSLCMAKHPSKYFLVEGELLCVIMIVAPFVPTKLAKTRYVTFITGQYSVWIPCKLKVSFAVMLLIRARRSAQ